jgi:hypothetical protein
LLGLDRMREGSRVSGMEADPRSPAQTLGPPSLL